MIKMAPTWFEKHTIVIFNFVDKGDLHRAIYDDTKCFELQHPSSSQYLATCDFLSFQKLKEKKQKIWLGPMTKATTVTDNSKSNVTTQNKKLIDLHEIMPHFHLSFPYII